MSKREVKQIKGLEKELFSEADRAEFWVRKNWHKAAIAALVAVAIGVSVYAINEKREAGKIAAQQAVFSAELKDLAKAIESNPDAPGIDFARLRLAGYYISEKKYDDAQKVLWVIFENSNADVALRKIAALENARVLELAGKTEAAANFYISMVSMSEFGVASAAECAFQAARLLVQLKTPAADSKAVNVLKNIIARKSNPDAASNRAAAENSE